MNNKIELDDAKYADLCVVFFESIQDDVYLILCLDFSLELMEIKDFTTFNIKYEQQ
jgi:hypothetical protein